MLGVRVLGVWCWMLVILLNLNCLILFGFRCFVGLMCYVLFIDCWLFVVYCLMSRGYWLLVDGCLLLVIGCWLLVVGCWLLHSIGC